MLKGRRNYQPGDSETSFFMNVVAERGIIVTYPSASVAQPGLDESNNVATVPSGTSGTPIGILLTDVVNVDLTKYHLNHHKVEEVQVGSKVNIVRRGWFITNKVKSGDTPTVGAAAHFDANGELTTGTTSARVGTFESVKDSDGYVRVFIDL